MATKILIIDDDSFVVVSTQMILERAGYQVLASESIDCLDLVARENPDLVLLDLNMPGMPGDEAARRLLALRPGFTGRIVFHSAEEGDELRRLAAEAGLDGYITKSSSVRQLLGQVEKVMGALPPAAAELTATAPPATTAEPAVPSPRLLVIEADEARRAALTRVFEAEGAQVRALSTPFCVNMIALESPHLVVIGRSLPALRSGALAAILAAIPGLPPPKVLDLSGGELAPDADLQRMARTVLSRLEKLEEAAK